MNITARNVGYAVGALLVGAVALSLLVTAVPGIVGAEGSYVVLSSSMSPSIGAGDVVVVNDVQPGEIQTGDVITFRPPGGADRPVVTHRVVEVVESGESPRFRTKGDANEAPDERLVPSSAVVGKVTFTIPLVGYLVNFANTDFGLFSLVVVPLVLLAISELWDLYRDGLPGDATGDGTGNGTGPADAPDPPEPADGEVE